MIPYGSRGRWGSERIHGVWVEEGGSVGDTAILLGVEKMKTCRADVDRGKGWLRTCSRRDI